MARSYITGFELNHLREAESFGGTAASIQSTIARSGTYALRVNASASFGYVRYNSRPAGGSLRSAFRSFRLYLRIASLPSAAVVIAGAGTSSAPSFGVRLNTDGTIIADDASGGSFTSTKALSADSTWHRIEFDAGYSGGNGVQVYVDGISWASGGSSAVTTQQYAYIGITGNATVDYYIDDVIWDDSAFAGSLPGAGNVILLIPTAGNNANSWTGGGGGTGDIHGGVDNIPPTGAATPADASQIKNAASGGNLDYVATMQKYQALVPLGSTINAIMAICNDAEEVSTNTKAGGIWCASNPAQAAGGNSFDYGDDAGAMGAFPSNWSTHAGPVAVAPSVTLSTAPTVTVRKTTSTTRVVDVDFMGLYVDFTPLTVSESITVSESETVSLITSGNLSKSVSDSISVAENVKAALQLGSRPSESISVAESVRAGLNLGMRPVDAITVSENVRSGLNLGVRPTDTITVGEFVNAALQLGSRPFEAITVADAVNAALQLGIRPAEIISVAENVRALLNPLAVNAQESITVSENVATQLGTRLLVAENITVAEAINVLLNPLAVHAQEAINVADVAIAALISVAGAVGEPKIILGYKGGSDTGNQPIVGASGSMIQ